MKVWSVIVRELRAQARQSFTYWLRTLGVVVLIGGAILFLGDNYLDRDLGGELFGFMHLLCYLSIWIFVPLSAADCISRERREGTLGLLFLTPLQPPHIVIAKSIAHGLRAGTLIVAIVPALMIPFLLGGVSWYQAVLAAAAHFNAVCWCLAAAVVASAFARTANRAMILACLLVFCGFILFPWTVGAILGLNSQTTWTSGYSQSGYDFFTGFSVVATPPGNIDYVMQFFKPAQLGFAMAVATFISVSALVVAVIVAANRTRSSWRDEPPSARVREIERVFCRPVIAVGFLRRWMQRKLLRNPIGWLEQRRWNGRMVTWAWFAVIVSVYSLVLTDRTFFRTSGGFQVLMGWLLALSMAITAAGSFRRERETGVLELLLVSPLTTGQIISGRLRGLWGQFLPSIILLLGIWIYFISIYHSIYRRSDGEGAQVFFFAVSFLVIPVIGLYFSVRTRHFIAALLLTLGTVFVAPMILSQLIELLPGSGSGRGVAKFNRIIFFQLLFAAIFWRRLHRNLENRTFSLERPVA